MRPAAVFFVAVPTFVVSSALTVLAVLVVALALPLLLAPAAFASPPSMTEEIVLDHGFRYGETVYYPTACAIGVSPSEVLLAFIEQGADAAYGYRKSPAGEEIDNAHQPLRGEEDGWIDGIDFSDPDGSGWKMAFAFSPSYDIDLPGLRVRAFDPATLEATATVDVVPPGVAEVRMPSIAFAPNAVDEEGAHVIAWLEGERSPYRLLLTRVTPGLEAIDPSPHVLASDLPEMALDLAMSDAGGMVLYVGDGRETHAQPLGQDGLPAGSPVALGEATGTWGPPEVAVARFADRWVAAWTTGDGIEVALLDATGAPIAPGPLTIDSTADMGLDVCAADSVALLAWRTTRDWDGRILVTRIGLDQESLDPEPVELVTESPCAQPEDPRNVACRWTGERFAVIWSTTMELPVSKEPAGQPAMPWPPENPVLLQWVPLEGLPIEPEPLRLNVGTHPLYAIPLWGSGEPHLLNREGGFYHRFAFDAEGQLTDTPDRWSGPSEHSDCDWMDNCDWARTSSLRSRADRTGVSIGYVRSEGWSGQLGEYSNDFIVAIDRIGLDGLRERFVSTVVAHQGGYGAIPAVGRCDFVERPDSIFFAYDYTPDRNTQSPGIRVDLIDPAGERLRRWTVMPDTTTQAATLAPLTGGRLLLLGLHATDSGNRVYAAIVDPAAPGEEITGTSLFPELGLSHSSLWLLRGDRQSLALFSVERAGGGGEHDVYAARFDENGALLDPGGIEVSRMPGTPGAVDGIWDGNQYFVTWSRAYPERGIFGNRIARDGVVIDGDGFTISEMAQSTCPAAADTSGFVLLAYAGNRIRIADDSIPLLDEDWDYTFPEDPADALALRIGRALPNPGRGGFDLEMELPRGASGTIDVVDPAGRFVARRTIDGP
ncbi:MAG: hypothetical protein QUU85_03990, partial [Candidatus Eisenbacteria bacterium]|nr:hypothetical protein [Candidatus Eisenbacteria bacterium]